jgi:hypothetical protein
MVRNASCNSGRRSGVCIDPEVSIRNTRFAGGKALASSRRPCSPISSNCRRSSHGAVDNSVVSDSGGPAGVGSG